MRATLCHLFKYKAALRLAVVLLWLPCTLFAGKVSEGMLLPAPEMGDTCTVCGMFVSKYPEWLATVHYRDGHSDHFDGAKDMFKYLFNLDKYAPGHSREDITAIGVTEYYGLTMVDAHRAWFVVGSDVMGPRGQELVPLASQEDAEEFLKDHQGERILTFDQVDRVLLTEMDEES